MNDNRKTKEQLIQELEDLRRKIVELEKSEAEHKRAKELLLTSEERLKAQYQGSPIPTFTWQKKGETFELTDFNPAALVATRGEAKKYLGKTAAEMYQGLQEIFQDIHRCFTEKKVIKRELRSQHFMPGRTMAVTYVFVPPDLIMVHTDDITERKQAEEALKATEEEYRLVVENVAESISIVQEGRLKFVNPGSVKILGYPPEVLTSKTFIEFIHSDDREMVMERHIKRMRGEEAPPIYSFRVVRRDGVVRWVEANAVVVPWKGKPAALNFLNDITERKEAEEALKASEEEYRKLFENASVGIFHSTPEGRFLRVNPALATMLGYGSSEDLVSSVTNISTQIYVDSKVRHEILANTLEEQGWVFAENQYRRKDGSIMIGKMNVRKELNPDGTVKYLEGFVEDISEPKRAEEKLRESEKKYRELFNNMTSGVAVYETKDNGNNFIIKDFNKGGEAIEQVKKEDILGKSVADVFPGVKEFGIFDVFQRVWKTGIPEHYPIKRYKDARIYGWRDNFVYKLPSGEIVSVYTDETQRKQAEETIEISLTKYQTLFETLPLGVTISDKAGNILESNKEAEKLLGLPRGNQFKRKIGGLEWHIIRPDGSPMPAEEYAGIRALKENCLVENVEMGIVKGEGESTWINVTAAPIPLEDYGVVIAYSDITERKRAEKEIEDLALFPQENPNPVLRVEPDGLIIYANEASKPLLFDWNTEVGNYLPTSLCKLLVDIVASKTKITVDISCGELVFSIMFSPTSDNRNVNIYGRDITERKQAEKALKASEERYRTIIETIEDGYYETDLAGNLTFFNDAMVRIHEYLREELLGMSNRQYTDAQNAKILFQEFSRVYRTGEPSKGTYYEIITKGGGRKNLEASVSLIRDSKGNIVGFRGIVRDVSELRKAEKALQTSEERFRVAAESSNDFIFEWDLQSGRIDWFGKAIERLGDMIGKIPDTNATFVKSIYPD
ncbi:MAG: PAS domain S-box protein, partial [Thermodesulfobacteriota bacterium]